MRVASNILLALAWIIGLAVAFLHVMMAMSNEVGIWMGGLGLLFFGLSILAVWLICVSVGNSLRKDTRTSQPQVRADKAGRRNFLEWSAIVLGTLLLLYLAFEVFFLRLFAVPSAFDALLGAGQSAPSESVLLNILAFIDIKLALGIAAITFGASRLRNKGEPKLSELP